MLHSGCVKRHQKFRDFVGLPMGLLRDGSPKTRMNTGLFGSWSGEVRSQIRSSRTTVQQALISVHKEIIVWDEKMHTKPQKPCVSGVFLYPRIFMGCPETWWKFVDM